jgi:hypothetical protein
MLLRERFRRQLTERRSIVSPDVDNEGNVLSTSPTGVPPQAFRLCSKPAEVLELLERGAPVGVRVGSSDHAHRG